MVLPYFSLCEHCWPVRCAKGFDRLSGRYRLGLGGVRHAVVGAIAGWFGLKRALDIFLDKGLSVGIYIH